MGPNPLKLCEELLTYADIPAGSVVLDLGSGAGLTSALMARERAIPGMANSSSPPRLTSGSRCSPR